MKPWVLCAALAGCASAPNHEADRARIMNATPVLCWAQSLPDLPPDAAADVAKVLAVRNVSCTTELNQQGRQMVLEQSARERDMNAAVQRQNNVAASRLLDALLLGAAAAAQQPAPPLPVNCYTQFGRTYATTSCH